jgi:nitronate monooxygenase
MAFEIQNTPEVCMTRQSLPRIIQGGMGVGISGWRLAQAVSRTGQLGVVSGTALAVIMARRLQLGDPGGHIRRALDHFPFPELAQGILDRCFIPEGKSDSEPFRTIPCPSQDPSRSGQALLVAANFVEVFLASEDHKYPVGINYLEKIQLTTLPSLFGAMLAGVDWVLMGAGIPRAIPGILDRLAAGEAVKLRLDIKDTHGDEEFFTEFDPQAFCDGKVPLLQRPRFMAIISSAPLGAMLVKKSTGRVDGLVVEGPAAGGHNAPPRGTLRLNSRGEPVYGSRDVPDLEAIQGLGVPFWLAGSYGTPDGLVKALEAGASGVQVGTAFAYCEESGLSEDLKKAVLAEVATGHVDVFTDPRVSPTGFPFKVVQLEGTLAESSVYQQRSRVCDLGYLRHGYKTPEGSLGWRCPAEALPDYERKGGNVQETDDRKCICNALLANIGLGQLRRDGRRELPLVTSGNGLADLAIWGRSESGSFAAQDVIDYVLSGVQAATPVAE